jgi:hypothetical protein
MDITERHSHFGGEDLIDLEQLLPPVGGWGNAGVVTVVRIAWIWVNDAVVATKL